MSELSYLEKLLDGADVEWLPLSDVCRFINGRAYKQEELLPQGKYPVLRVGNFFTNQNWYYSDLELEQDKYCDKGDLLYAWSASFGPRIWGEGKSIYHYHIWKVVPDTSFICKQFLYYLLQWDVKALKDAHSTGSTMMHVSKSAIEKRTVPIPCPNNPEKSLAIQSEIVRILDKFTALTAELTAELTARKKQYSYYRDQLLSFEDVRAPYLEKLLDGAEVEWRKLSDLVDLRRGRVMSKGYLVDNIGRYPVYSSQTANNGMIGSIDTFDFDGEFVSWTTDGANAGTVFYRTGKFSITNVCGLIKINDSSPLNYKYLFYWLTIEAKSHVYSGMGNPKLMSHQVEKIPVPIPCPGDPEKSLAIQSEIVRILDKFDTLTSSISEGLPREIELRQKQYEYYRDLLFSFPKPESVTN